MVINFLSAQRKLRRQAEPHPNMDFWPIGAALLRLGFLEEGGICLA